MALSVLNNIASLAAQNQLSITNGNLQKALFQLSSGSRINTGADDAAGLAIADGLHANITALTQSARNANDGVGELQVADGSLAQVTTLLNRAITLATESATGTVSDPQRVALDAEYTAIKAEVDRVGSKTNYNGGQVFTANTLNVFLSDAGATSNSTIGVTTGVLSSTGLGLGGAVAATGTLTQAAGAAAVAATDTLTGGAFVASAVATDTLTATGAPVATNTATINGQVYTFVAALTGAANEVLVGGTEAASLTNLAAAINATSGGAGVVYGTGTVANAAVTATSTATTVVITSKLNGTAGNGVTAVGAGGTFTFGTAATAGGTAGSTVTVGGKTYTFVAALSTTPTANEVVSSSEATGLANLAAAVNAGAGSGTTYSTPTAQNANVTAGTATGTTLLFTATSPGTGGNFITGAATVGSFGTANFAGGANAGAAPVAAAGNTVTVGGQTYTFVTALSSTPTANEVLVGATEAASLTNLANAVNGASGAGSTYGSPTVANTSVTAVATATTVGFTAITKGLAGNSVTTSETGTANTFGGSVLTGGTAGSVNDLLNITDATAALATINTAIQTVAGLRGTIGATVNRLQSAAGVINNQVQNLTGAEDGVRAADIPSTVATLAKYSILEQTGISALAQANQQQQLVLKLLQ
jgi:flagellin